MNEIDRLNSELAKKPTEVETVKYVETVKTITEVIPSTFVIQFAQNSSQLSEEAKEILDGVKGRVKVVAYASPEGTSEYNQRLSEKRAAVITDYLTNRDIKVISFRGLGCINENSNRIGIVEIMTAE
jgi:outer membrane protein OmpA-like peptidoglycan-associated protein